MKYNILVIDDDNLVCLSLKNILNREGFVSDYCDKTDEIFLKVEVFKPDIILLDIYLGELNGLEVLLSLQKDFPFIPVIMITGYADVQIAVTAMKSGAYDFLLKPVEKEKLLLTINRCIESLRLKNEVARLEAILSEDIITREYFGQSKSILRTINFIDKIVKSADTTVLLEGESGTGKEIIAKYIHQQSPRSKHAFITVNCGSIPKELAESELFGHEKGAFTGAAQKTKLGKFELADGGTILLDEIGELSMELQVKLLRVLQEKRFYRLGGEKEISVDVRVLAATNKDLSEEIQKGTFREDLYFRLNVAKVVVPPLRERIEDIPILCYRFASEFSQKFNRVVKRIDQEAIDLLVRYAWKGNVRELRNAMERAVLILEGDELKLKHFGFLKNSSFGTKSDSSDKFVLRIPQHGVDYNTVIKELIQKTLQMTNGNQVKTATILNLTRAKLRYKMKELGIVVSKKIE